MIETTTALQFLRAREVAAILNLSENEVRRALRQGLIPGIRIGRRWRVSAQALEASGWLKRVDDGSVRIAGWKDRQAKLIQRRQMDADRKRKERAERKKSAEFRKASNGHPPDVPRTSAPTNERTDKREKLEAAPNSPCPDTLLSIPCRISEKDSTPKPWHLRPEHVSKLEETHPISDVLAVAQEWRKKVLTGARRPRTHLGMFAALAEWVGNAEKWGQHPKVNDREAVRARARKRNPDTHVGEATEIPGWNFGVVPSRAARGCSNSIAPSRPAPSSFHVCVRRGSRPISPTEESTHIAAVEAPGTST